mgnify:CR=1 FL=1
MPGWHENRITFIVSKPLCSKAKAMTMKAIIKTIFLLTLALTGTGLDADQPNDPQLDRLINNAQITVQRKAIQFAGKQMFNNANDWQRWANQVNSMQPQQLNGLLNILNAPQRQMLFQQQQWVSQWVRQQWLQQHFWMQQNAFANLPFGMMPWGFNQPRVYYAPVVQWFRQGVQFNANAVVSPDRRHVRMNLNPIFSSIGPIHNYNMRNGNYYRPNAYRQPYGYNNTHHSRVQRANYMPAPQQNPRKLPDWYLKNRNNP